MSALPDPSIRAVVNQLRDTAESQRTHSRRFRMTQLKGIKNLLADNTPALLEALHHDLGKPAFEAMVTEISVAKTEAEHAHLHVTDWMDDRTVRMPVTWQPATGYVRPRPVGTVLILAPWNYPVRMSLTPLVAAVAAGNTALIAANHQTPATSQLLAELIPDYLDPAAVSYVAAEPADPSVPGRSHSVMTELLGHRWDHIVCSGSTQLGRQVYTAAAEYLTPVTMSLSGKSPVVVSDGRAWPTIARRVGWGKWLNNGQSSIAPDYVLTVGGRATRQMEELLPEVITEFYGENPAVSEDYGRLISVDHTKRVVRMLEESLGQGAELVHGGRYDLDARFLEPTVVTGVTGEMSLMQEEIFGPVLPIIRVKTIDEAISFIRARPTPPAAYLFTDRPRVRRAFEDRVDAGGMGFDVTILQAMVPTLPVGGGGHDSGFGLLHGHAGFLQLSQLRSEIAKTDQVDTLKSVYPPYTWTKRQIAQRMF